LTSSTQGKGGSDKTKPTLDRDVVEASSEQDYDALKGMLQEKRRAFTIMRAEAEKERELREALQAQLLDANAEIVASWDRRKEMARVIGDMRQLVAGLKNVIANREQAIAKRDKMLADRQKVIANRDQKISDLYEELAALERHIVQSTLSGKAKRLVRRARQVARKSFQAP
jgi:uncharacterized coiled-coil protein SlyX